MSCFYNDVHQANLLERKYFGITVCLMTVVRVLPSDYFTKSKHVPLFFPRLREDCGPSAQRSLVPSSRQPCRSSSTLPEGPYATTGKLAPNKRLPFCLGFFVLFLSKRERQSCVQAILLQSHKSRTRSPGFQDGV